MRTTKVFKCGNSQAVRLPKEFQIDADEVEILRRGDELVIRRIPLSLKEAYDILAHLSDDFMSEGREDAPPQEREGF